MDALLREVLAQRLDVVEEAPGDRDGLGPAQPDRGLGFGRRAPQRRILRGDRTRDAVTGSYAEARKVLDDLAAVGVDYDDVTALLEKEGVEKFIVSWNELLDTVTAALEAAGRGAAQ